MVSFVQIWPQYQSGLAYLSYQAYNRSAQRGAFAQEDFLQEAAICVLQCLDRYGESCSKALIYKVVKNRFSTILHSQYLESRAIPSYIAELESFEPLSLTPFLVLAQNLSPLAQQILWLLVDPPDSLWEKMALQETAKISRKIVAECLGVAPQRVSEAAQELKEVLRREEIR